MYTKERYYEDESIHKLEDVFPAAYEINEEKSEKVTNNVTKEEDVRKAKDNLQDVTTEIKPAVKGSEKKTDSKKKYKNIYMLFLIQPYGTKTNEKGEKVPADPVPEIKSITVEEHETFKDILAGYERFKGGVFIKDLFYPIETKGNIVRVAELSKEEVLSLTKYLSNSKK